MNIFSTQIIEDLGESIEIAPLNPKDIIADYIPPDGINDPISLLYIGLFISVLCGISFAYLMRIKLINWETKKEPPLPLENVNTISTWVGFFIGLTIIFTSALHIFDFSIINSLIFSIVISLLFGITMWKAVKDLMTQLQEGNIKEIDEYF